MKVVPGFIFMVVAMILLNGCRTSNYDKVTGIEREPRILPDYSGVTIPRNIAPMNFKILEEASAYIVNASSSNGGEMSIKSSDGIVRFPQKSWTKLLQGTGEGRIEVEVLLKDHQGNLMKFESFHMVLAGEPIDPYLCYRLLFPGYETWNEIMIIQRNVESFYERPLIENQLLENNCVNCHSFNQNSPDRFLLHVRGSKGGTYFVEKDEITRTDLRTEEMKAGAVYSAWHPGGRYISFSSNNVIQNFHALPEMNIEVIDLFSSLLLYDSETNEMLPVKDSDRGDYMETFPEWSPDGKYLYYCRADHYDEGSDFKNIKYNLVRKSFDEESRSFGKTEVVFDAQSINKSVSFPRISPNGKYLVFTLHSYGTFSIWHREADLYLIDLQSNQTSIMSLNSTETESYHSWSMNSKWLVFSSKRGDGLSARPYFAYIGSPGKTGKPFVLPQKDPMLYNRMIKTFNKPEFVTDKINIGPRQFAKASSREAKKASWVDEIKHTD